MSDPKKIHGEKKPPLDATPPIGIFTMAMAMEDGAGKYGPMNYRESKICARTYYNAAMRHWMAWWDGEDLADDSGVHHLGHAMACACIILDAQASGTLIDDRPPKGKLADWLKAHKKDDEPNPAAVYGHRSTLSGMADSSSDRSASFPETKLWRAEARIPVAKPARVAENSGVSKQDAERIADTVQKKPDAQRPDHGLHFPRAHMSALLAGTAAPFARTFPEVMIRTKHVIMAMADAGLLDKTAIEKMPDVLAAPSRREDVSRKEFVEAVNLMALLLTDFKAAIFRRVWLDYAAPVPGKWNTINPMAKAQATQEHWRFIYLAAPMSNVRDFNFPFLYSAEWEYALQQADDSLWPFNPARAARLDSGMHAAPDALSPEGDHSKLSDAYNIRNVMRRNLDWLTTYADVVRVQFPVSENSKGVAAELAVAKAIGIPVAQARPHDHWCRVAARKDVPLALLPFLGPMTDFEREAYDSVSRNSQTMFCKPRRKDKERKNV